MAVAAMVGCGLWPLEGLGSEMFTGTVLAKTRVDSTATNSWASNKLTQCSGRSTWGILYHQIEPEGKRQGADDETKEDMGMHWRVLGLIVVLSAGPSTCGQEKATPLLVPISVDGLRPGVPPE